ncbi:MAG TPA: histidine--tRNA ligase [Bacteroidota bacterium]
MTVSYRAIRGTKDILPIDSPKWQSVENTIRDVMHLWNYREIRTPAFEETGLFARGIGELTDIVAKEMYTLKDRSDTSITLKPEMTASVVRAYLQNNLGKQLPLVKVYYIAAMFRQERPQAGRLRQFHQFGAEAIGSPYPEVDAELIGLSVAVYERFGIRNALLKVNSVGCPLCRPRYKELLKSYLKPLLPKLSEETQHRYESNPLRILDSKEESDREIIAGAPMIKDHLCTECADHFRTLQEQLGQMKLKFEVDGRIVRGLDYYTRTAYEIISPDLGSQDALAGGGRYDLLVKELGGKETPAVGFAAGIERLLMVLEKQKYDFQAEVNVTVFLAATDDAGRAWSLERARELRAAGLACEVDLLKRSLKAQMKEADRQRVRFVIIVGDKELKDGAATVRNMKSGVQEQVKFDRILDHLKAR